MKLQVAPKGYPNFHSLSIFSIPSKKVWMTTSKNSESEYQPSFFSCSSCRKRNLKDSSISSRAFNPFIKSNIAFCLNDDAKIIIFWWFTKLFKGKIIFWLFFINSLRGSWNGNINGKEVHFPNKQPGPIPFCSRNLFQEQNGMGRLSNDNGTKKSSPERLLHYPLPNYSAIKSVSISEILDLIRPRMKPMNSTNTNRFDKAKISPLPYPPENFSL